MSTKPGDALAHLGLPANIAAEIALLLSKAIADNDRLRLELRRLVLALARR